MQSVTSVDSRGVQHDAVQSVLGSSTSVTSTVTYKNLLGLCMCAEAECLGHSQEVTASITGMCFAAVNHAQTGITVSTFCRACNQHALRSLYWFMTDARSSMQPGYWHVVSADLMH